MKFLTKLVAKHITLALVILFISTKGAGIHIRYLRAKTEDSIVRILKEDGSGGTGFGVKTASGRTVFITNKHVCELPPARGAHTVFVVKDGGMFKRKVIAIDNDHDLCIVENITDEDPVIKIGSLAKVGDDIAIIGHPLLSPLQVSRGTINTDIIQENLGFTRNIDLPGIVPVQFTNAPSYPGNSGSPAVNFYGHLVGILFAGAGPHINMIIPLNSVVIFLNRH